MADKKRTSTVTAADIKTVRGELTQIEAAKLVPCSRRAYQSYESGTVAMSEATFEYFKKMARKALRGAK
jgi:hypothetical protein